MNWFQELKSVYFANATAARDYRVQLRGSRSVLVFGLYLAVLIGVAMTSYVLVVEPNSSSVVTAQAQLQMFYRLVMGLLAGMICLITPALTATTVVTERQRHSFDLIFSAPVSARYYLVGKMISSYRYTWMLLILSLPVTASAVILGGASWSDVLVAYALLSLHAVALTAVGLLMSTITQKPATAVTWSYASIGLYLLFSSTISASMMMGASRETFFGLALNPFFASYAADTYTTILGVQVPNWIPALLTILLFTRITLLAAGTALGNVGAKEGRSLRIHGLVYVALIFALVGQSSLSSSVSMAASLNLGRFLVFMLSPLALVIPLMTCYGYEGERRYYPNGAFAWRKMLDGSPAGALPYLLTLAAIATASIMGGAYLSAGFVPQAEFVAFPLFAVAMLTFLWGVGRHASAWAGGLRQARMMVLSVFVLLTVIPPLFLTALRSSDGNFDNPLWNMWILYPMFKDDPSRPTQIIGYAALLAIAGIVLNQRSQVRFAPKIRRDLIEDDQLYVRA